uniref:Large ribosomal subunit protein mL64 n=1 Tax=Triatoma dimidiata TaxID=72491 RepID=A0A0V0GB24_TRIDM
MNFPVNYCKLIRRSNGLRTRILHANNIRLLSKVEEKVPSEELYSVSGDDSLEAYLEEKEAEIEAKRNKSMLRPQHYNILHGNVPYDEPKCDIHYSLRYKKRMFGRYGYESGVNPGALWPSSEEINEKMEYEKVAFPYTIMEMLERVRQRRENEEKLIQERQAKLASNMKKLEQWKQDIAARAAKKIQVAAAAKAKKDALIEEVRRHFGYKVDPKDEKFKDMLLQKERDQKKKLKAERAKAKQEMLLASLEKS